MEEQIKTLKYLDHTAKVIIKNPNDHIQKYWLNGHFYETQRNGMLNMIYKHYQGGTFMDIGGSIGNHSLFFAICCKADRVDYFEPYTPSYNHAIENMQQNYNAKVVLHNYGFSDRDKKTGMRVKDLDNVGNTLVDDSSLICDFDFYPLNNIKSEYDLIKIDVEHHNKQIFAGGKDFFSRQKCDIFIECESKPELLEAVQFFNPLGYKTNMREVYNHTATYRFHR